MQPADRFFLRRKLKLELSQSGFGLFELFVELGPRLGHGVGPEEGVGDDLGSAGTHVFVRGDH